MGVHRRRRIARGSAAIGVVAAFALGACSSGSSSHPAVSSTTPVTSGAAGVDSAAPNWTVYGHDLDNTRLNPHETTISRDTVSKLRVAWSKKGLVGVTGTPVVAAGVVYYGDWT
jgi:glucose dehydrogenase